MTKEEFIHSEEFQYVQMKIYMDNLTHRKTYLGLLRQDERIIVRYDIDGEGDSAYAEDLRSLDMEKKVCTIRRTRGCFDIGENPTVSELDINLEMVMTSLEKYVDPIYSAGLKRISSIPKTSHGETTYERIGEWETMKPFGSQDRELIMELYKIFKTTS